MVTDEQRLVAGRYRLVTPLGSGGMGTVWRAEDVVLGREVAVKEVTFPHGLSQEDREVLRERTRREARAAARLDHPSAVTVYDVVEEGGSPYLVMELVEARTLSQVVRADGPLSPQRTAQVGLDLLGALQTAHAQGIVHRDVKPGNVLLTANGRVVLTDFGIASSAGDSSITSTGLLLGSPAYIAPERARGHAPGPASDLWSLGATLFTAVEGRPPYDGGEPLLTVTAVVTGEHEPFVAAGPLVPVLEGLLERDPEARLTVSQARALLTPLAEHARPASAPAPAPSPDAERRTEATTALPMDQVRASVGGAAGPTARTAPTWSRPPVLAEPRRRRARAPVVALGVAAAVAAGIGGYALTDRGGAGTGGGATATASPSPDAVQQPAALPAGWEPYTDPEEGWTIGVPPGYDRSTYRGTQVQLRDEQTRFTLRVDWSADPAPSALAAWQAFSPQLATALTGYQQRRLAQVEFMGLDAADLEFTHTSKGADLHVLDRTFVSADGGQAVALYWQVNDEDYAGSLELFEQLAATFRFA